MLLSPPLQMWEHWRPMVMVILSILLGIAGIAVMTHQAGRESLNLQIRQLIDKTNKNAVGTFKAVIEPTVKSLKYVFMRPVMRPVYFRNYDTLARNACQLYSCVGAPSDLWIS